MSLRTAAHAVKGVREAMEARVTRLLYLPPCSHDRNPIEQAFSKLEALLRQVESHSLEALWRTIGSLLARISPRSAAT